jgi:hypothetical protein
VSFFVLLLCPQNLTYPEFYSPVYPIRSWLPGWCQMKKKKSDFSVLKRFTKFDLRSDRASTRFTRSDRSYRGMSEPRVGLEFNLSTEVWLRFDTIFERFDFWMREWWLGTEEDGTQWFAVVPHKTCRCAVFSNYYLIWRFNHQGSEIENKRSATKIELWLGSWSNLSSTAVRP